MVLWYSLVGHVVGLLGNRPPQVSGTWWYVDDSPHLAGSVTRAKVKVHSEKARLLKTVKDHDCDSKILHGPDRRLGPGMPTPCTDNLGRYRLRQESVGSQYYKILVYSRLCDQFNVQSSLIKPKAT